MTTYPGRGAWSVRGKDNGATAYCYLTGKPLDGHRQPDGTFKDLNYEAVHYGVLALQKRLNTLLDSAIITDGVLGPQSDQGIRQAQHRLNLVVDGAAGPHTCRALWHPLIDADERTKSLPRHILWGIAVHESLLDPGAVGASTPGDKGLVQYNTTLGSITIAQAFDPGYALSHAAIRLRSALDGYGGKGSEIQLSCAIASWNSPVWADEWYSSGVAPNTQIAKYVNDVLTVAATF
jgi:hypothetical protein